MKGRSLTQLLADATPAQDVVTYYHDRLKKHNPTLNACVSDGATEPEVNSQDGLLRGLPLLLKDNISTTLFPTTASSDVLRSYIPPFDATVTTRLTEAGATILGKTNLDAWAHGSSTETSDFGVTHNPYNLDHVPGGSSGGSASAVSAGLTPGAIGTETAGSIRLPASWSGIVGLKPTYGRVSRHGIVAMGSSWDCPGPMTQTVEDAALLLEILAGRDPHDATTLDAPVSSYREQMRQTTKRTIGVPATYFEDVDPEIHASVQACIDMLKEQGHTVVPVELMHPSLAISVYMLLQRSEVSSNLARFDGIRYGQDRTHFHDEAKKRIVLGTYALSAGYYDEYYKKAQKVRYLIRENFIETFMKVDALIAPTAPIVATRIGDSASYAFYGEKMDVLTEPASASGIPAISIPSGMHSTGLPIGVQLMGRHCEEGTILQLAHELEGMVGFDRLSVMNRYE